MNGVLLLGDRKVCTLIRCVKVQKPGSVHFFLLGNLYLT